MIFFDEAHVLIALPFVARSCRDLPPLSTGIHRIIGQVICSPCRRDARDPGLPLTGCVWGLSRACGLGRLGWRSSAPSTPPEVVGALFYLQRPTAGLSSAAYAGISCARCVHRAHDWFSRAECSMTLRRAS